MAQTEQKNQNVKKQFEELQSLLERAMALQTSMVLFEWDDETLAPKGAAEHTARVIGSLSEQYQEILASMRFKELLDVCLSMRQQQRTPVAILPDRLSIGRVLRCILAAKHRALSPGAARRPVERKRDRVKDRRFACPRIARDQEQSRPRPFEINLRHAPIRAKRRHCKQLRFHTRSSSSASSTMRARIVSWSSVIGQWRTAS